MRVRALMATTLALGAVLAGCTSGPVPPVDGPAAAEPLTTALPTPALRWGPCPAVPDAPPPGTPGLSCATMTVPLDYRRPGGPTLDIAVSRLSTGPGHPAVVSNPGGPGAPGLFDPSGWDAATGGRLALRDDLIGFDPRGVRASSPLDCHLDDTTAGDETGAAVPTTFDADAESARRLAQACAPEAARLPYFTTLDTVRDVEMLRRALGVERLSFLGVSYGTELATVFASVFPGSTDRVLLDSAQDVTRPYPQARAATAGFFARRADEVTAALARGDDRYHLGRTSAAVRALYLRTADELLRRPADLAGDPVTAASLESAGLIPAILDDAGIDAFGRSLGWLARVPGGPSTEALLAQLGPPSSGAGGLLGGQPLSQNVSIYWAVRCGDDRWSRDLTDVRRATEAEQAATPITRGKWSNVTPCAFWPTPPAEPRPVITDRGFTGGPNILVLKNTGDYRALPDGVDRLTAALGRRAVTVTATGREHGVFFHDGCARDRAIGWLVDGQLPGPDERRC